MAKQNTICYVCSNCGEEYLKWQGKCDNCSSWNTLKEFSAKITNASLPSTEILSLDKISVKNFNRISSRINEVDRVLGGGIVPGSVILLGGEPGIGKSTLVMQLASKIGNTFYVSGEESLEQIKMRADRLKIKNPEISLVSQTNIDCIIQSINKFSSKPKLIIIDSVQTMYCQDYPSTAGSLVQVRESALRLQNYAKSNNIPIILIGHVTKEGSVAGPKTLEHMVDVVLYLEGERYRDMRILRSVKNRFGSTDEIGLFELSGLGLLEIKNPSKMFLADYDKQNPGAVVTATMEGSRPLLIEIQALTSPTSFGYPKRTASGFDLNRLQLIIAILINRGGFNLSSQDVYLNAAGGYYLKEPAADLAVAIAIVSAFKHLPIKSKTVVFGEMGLGGEIRPVNFESKRIVESNRLGFTGILKVKSINQAIKELFNV